jgi:ferritin-like metal-binding protein YciE
VLAETLAEEKATDKDLTKLAEQKINLKSAA